MIFILNFYIIVFLVGVLYTFVSIIISGFSGAFHSHADLGANVHGGDVGHHGHAGHSTDAGNNGADASVASHSILSWFTIILNPLVAVSFLTVFGGMGILGIKFIGFKSIIILLIALASGIIVSALLYNFVAKPLYRSENSTDVSREELLGTTAEVTTDIIEQGYGTIMYTVNSIRYTAPAKHLEEKAVKQGEKVVICKIEDNTFYISEVSSILK